MDTRTSSDRLSPGGKSTICGHPVVEWIRHGLCGLRRHVVIFRTAIGPTTGNYVFYGQVWYFSYGNDCPRGQSSFTVHHNLSAREGVPRQSRKLEKQGMSRRRTVLPLVSPLPDPTQTPTVVPIIRIPGVWRMFLGTFLTRTGNSRRPVTPGVAGRERGLDFQL